MKKATVKQVIVEQIQSDITAELFSDSLYNEIQQTKEKLAHLVSVASAKIEKSPTASIVQAFLKGNRAGDSALEVDALGTLNLVIRPFNQGSGEPTSKKTKESKAKGNRVSEVISKDPLDQISLDQVSEQIIVKQEVYDLLIPKITPAVEPASKVQVQDVVFETPTVPETPLSVAPVVEEVSESVSEELVIEEELIFAEETAFTPEEPSIEIDEFIIEEELMTSDSDSEKTFVIEDEEPFVLESDDSLDEIPFEAADGSDSDEISWGISPQDSDEISFNSMARDDGDGEVKNHEAFQDTMAKVAATIAEKKDMKARMREFESHVIKIHPQLRGFCLDMRQQEDQDEEDKKSLIEWFEAVFPTPEVHERLAAQNLSWRLYDAFQENYKDQLDQIANRRTVVQQLMAQNPGGFVAEEEILREQKRLIRSYIDRDIQANRVNMRKAFQTGMAALAEKEELRNKQRDLQYAPLHVPDFFYQKHDEIYQGSEEVAEFSKKMGPALIVKKVMPVQGFSGLKSPLANFQVLVNNPKLIEEFVK